MSDASSLTLRVKSQHRCRRCKITFKVFGKVLVFGAGSGEKGAAWTTLFCPHCGAMTNPVKQAAVPPIFTDPFQ